MNKIISTTGAVIEFTLTAEKVFTIDPVNPIEVSDEDLAALEERLGSQISVVDEEITGGGVDAATSTTNKDAVELNKAPILKEYKILTEEGLTIGETAYSQGEVVELDALDENTIALLTSGEIEEEIPQV